MKILLVDDSRSIAEVFTQRLQAFGHEVLRAENGADAVKRFREFAPDLVLMDIEMPVMNGFEATGQIRKFEKSKRWAWTPIIFLTSADTADNVVSAIEAGGDDLIPKNVPEPVLRAKLMALSRVAGLRHELLAANRQMEDDIRRREQAESELSRRFDELAEANRRLSQIQEQLIQSEKMASIGQLAAGVAHEINTPIGFVRSNICTLDRYLSELITTVDRCVALADRLPPELGHALRNIDLGYLQEDSRALIDETRDGVDRVKDIVQNLQEFARIDAGEAWQFWDVHHGVESALQLLASEITARAEIVKHFGVLPLIECRPHQLNQVFLNLLSNIEHAFGVRRGHLTIRTGISDDTVWLEFEDDGAGMNEEVRKRAFDPFFTTKAVGKGPGLGLSLAYGIIRNHHGQLAVVSSPGRGSCFRISLPVRQPAKGASPKPH